MNIFGVIYVGLPILFLIILLVYYFSGHSVSKESVEKIIDISKWYMVSVALVFSAKIIESSFSEREAGIKEMQVYDKYVETILKADNIESRWKLAEYFATVTPTERLRARWIAYKEILINDYNSFKELKDKEAELSSKVSLTSEETNKLMVVQRNIAPFERKLLDADNGRWAIVFTADKSLRTAEYELTNLKKAGIDEPRTLFKSGNYLNISKVFPGRNDANKYLDMFRSKVRKDVYIVNLNVWCPNEVYNDNGKYYECN
jgi:hypothetical protein